MDDEQMEDGLEALYKEPGAKTKNLDGSEHGNILSHIKEVQQELFKNKIKPSTSGEGPDPTTILPHGELPGKKVITMKISKRRIDIDPMGL